MLKNSKKLLITVIVLIAFVISVIFTVKHFTSPRCTFCDSKVNISEKYGIKMCAECYEAMQDENNSTIIKGTKPKDFTNKYGTSTTVCAYEGCTNYIAKSGNTDCCEKHSKKCLKCGEYSNNNTMYCSDCIKEMLNK